MHAHKENRASRGIALGVTGVVMLVAFSILFMVGRHTQWDEVYDEVVHPFDEHPDGLQKHHTTVVHHDAGEVTLSGLHEHEDIKKEMEELVNKMVDAKMKLEREAFAKDKLELSSQMSEQMEAVKHMQETVEMEIDAIKELEYQVEDKLETPFERAAIESMDEKKPAETKPVVTQPAETKPIETPPVETKPAETKPVETTPVETKPAETKSVETTPVETKPAEKKPAETSPAVTKSAEGGEALTVLDQKYKPTREMVQKIAQDGYLVVTWANWHYQDFVHTWVMHVKQVGITGYIVGAMDEHLLEVMIQENINCFSMKSGLTLGDFGWGSKTFAKMGREKIKLIALFLKLGVDVVIADVDVLFLRNPIPYFQRYPDVDMLTSSDHLINTVPDESLEIFPSAGSAYNIGIMMFRNKSLDFVNEWIDVIEKDETVWDQNAFNDLAKRGAKQIPGDKQNVFLTYGGTLRTGILPVSIFCSGHTYFTQRLAEKLKLDVYAVHATFQFSGTPGKRNRMRERMLFNDPPEYYDHKVGFIQFNFGDLTGLLLHAGPSTGKMDLENVQGHFMLVNHQIALTRQALAIATVLGRAVVMPQLWCGLDRWWAPHGGNIPGSKFDLPFPCPLDHVFDLENGWNKELGSADVWGPNIEYKESSFFNNSKMTPAVRDSRVIVEICPAGTAGCSDGSAPAPVTDGRVKVQEGLLSEQLKIALRDASQFKVLDFTTMQNAFKNFSSPQDWQRFQQRMRVYGSIWCCIHAHPGHIHYDLLWDVPGHKDKFERVWDKWIPKTGP